MKNNTIQILLLVVFVASLVTGASLTKKEFEEKAQLKETIHKLEKVTVKDSINIITIFDTNHIPVIDYVKEVATEPFAVQVYTNYSVKDSATLRLDYLLWGLQNSNNIDVPMWARLSKYDKINSVKYYSEKSYTIASMLRDSLATYTGVDISLFRKFDKRSNLILVHFSE